MNGNTVIYYNIVQYTMLKIKSFYLDLCQINVDLFCIFEEWTWHSIVILHDQPV